MFVDHLISQIKLKNNPSVFGLDPSFDKLPEFIRQRFINEYGNTITAVANAILFFNKKLIDSLYDIIPCVKIQSAYFEMYGVEGVQAFYDTVKYAKSKGLIVIGDVKRGDIDTTAKAYSTGYLGNISFDDTIFRGFDTDCITVNPYLGIDGVKPFIEDCKQHNRGIFILVKTSNKSSGDLQDLKSEDKHIYEIIAEYVNKWGSDVVGQYGYSSVGAVVGATYPEQAKVLRNIMPNNYFLVPGYGAQGGGAKDVVNCFNEDGLGAIISASRSIMYAYKSEFHKDKFGEEEFDTAAREEAIRMRDEINSAI